MNHCIGELCQNPGSLTCVKDETSTLVLGVVVVVVVVLAIVGVPDVAATVMGVLGMVRVSDHADKFGWKNALTSVVRVGSRIVLSAHSRTGELSRRYRRAESCTSERYWVMAFRRNRRSPMWCFVEIGGHQCGVDGVVTRSWSEMRFGAPSHYCFQNQKVYLDMLGFLRKNNNF